MTEPDSDATRLAALRKLLPATGAGIYLATATRGPLPAETAAQMRDADDWELRVGRATEGRDEDLLQRLAEARAVLAALVVGDPADIALTGGAGPALTVAAWAPDWRPGDRAVTVAGAGPDILAALDGVHRRFEVAIDVVDRPEPRALAAVLTDRTRLVMLPHVEPHTGRLLAVSGIASAIGDSGAWLAVDASLSAGAIPLDVGELGADLLALAGDRWLLGPEGTGALWVGSRVRAAGRADLSGATAYEMLQPSVARPWPDARRFEPTSLPRTAVLGLARSVGWLEMYVGLEWALGRNVNLARRLHAALANAAGVEVATPAESMASVVCFRLPAWPAEEALAELRRRVFAIIDGAPGGTWIRVSTAWFNTDEEIDRFGAAVAELARHTPDTLPRRPTLVVS